MARHHQERVDFYFTPWQMQRFSAYHSFVSNCSVLSRYTFSCLTRKALPFTNTMYHLLFGCRVYYLSLGDSHRLPPSTTFGMKLKIDCTRKSFLTTPKFFIIVVTKHGSKMPHSISFAVFLFENCLKKSHKVEALINANGLNELKLLSGPKFHDACTDFPNKSAVSPFVAPKLSTQFWIKKLPKQSPLSLSLRNQPLCSPKFFYPRNSGSRSFQNNFLSLSYKGK